MSARSLAASMPPVRAPRVPTRRRFTVDEYHRLSDAGVIPFEQRTELIDGEIFCMAAIGSRHAASVERGGDTFRDLLGGRARVRTQNPVRLNDFAELEPDLCVVLPSEDYFVDRHPGPEDVLLIVEVADTSLNHDRRTKLPVYAVAGIRESWLVNLVREVVEVYRDPVGRRYGSVLRYRRGDYVAPLAYPDIAVPVDALLGPAR